MNGSDPITSPGTTGDSESVVPLDEALSRMVAEDPSFWLRRSLATGEVLWFEGDLADEIAVVETGALDVLRGRAHRIATVSAGQMLGEASAFLDASVRTATLRASAPTELLILGRAELSLARDKWPDLYDALIERALITLADRVESAGRRIARMSEGTLPRPTRTEPEPGGDRDEPADGGAEPSAEAALRRSPRLASEYSDTIRSIGAAMTARRVPAGTTLILEGEPGTSLFVLARGRLAVQRSVGTHTATHLGILLPGGVVGTGGLILGRLRNASCIALEDSWVLEMDRSNYTALTGEPGRVWREALVHSLRDQIVSVGSHVERLNALRAERLGQAGEADAIRASLDAALMWAPPAGPLASNAETVATAVLRQLFRHRRLLPGSSPCDENPCDDCLALHRSRVERAVGANRPVPCVLPAFPAKSPSPAKTLGTLPDMAEEQALRYLQGVCDAVAEIYPPGLEVTICSDGRVFSDLVHVTDDDVTDYGRAVVTMIEHLGMRSLSTFNMEDLFEVTSFDGMRDHLLVHYAEPVTSIRERVGSQHDDRSMFNGIQRFLFEDSTEIDKQRSRTQIRNDCKVRAYQVIQRSNAWTRLVAECFPSALRLSIHPQPAHSNKVGVLLGEAEDAWMTPWHSVALREGDRWRFVKRRVAEEMGALLVECNGRPSHYEVRG